MFNQPGESNQHQLEKSVYIDSEIYDLYSEHINPAYPSFLYKLGLNNIAVRAEGSVITDSKGRTFIDCIGGYGLFNLGHNHPAIIHAISDQLNERQLFTKPLITEIPVMLAESLSKITPGDLTCSFICNSGSEAIDSAIKLARLHSGKRQIIAAENSFHGYTFGALSASGISAFKRFFEPMVPDIVHVPFGDIKSLKKIVSDATAAVLLEPVQHEAGVFLPPEGYFQEVQKICDEKGIILILDEIKTGFGRTGEMFTCQQFDIVPDILVLGKSLGGGLMPIGSVIAKKSLWKKFGLSFPMSASSYAWNILACRAAITTIKIILESDLLKDCKRKGRFLLREFRSYVKKYPKVLKSVSGIGLLIGIETVSPRITFELSRGMIQQGILAITTFGNSSVLMIEPPLIISFEQIKKIIHALDLVCERISRDV